MAKLGSQIGTCPLEEEEDTYLTVRASLFFDGTLNNMANVAAGQQQRAQGEKIAGSYANDYSNVARLRQSWSDKTTGADIVLAVYAEGPGSDTGDGDSIRGSALGTGRYGVTAKVEAGINDLVVDLIKALKRKEGSVLQLDITVDVFGFSRGAAGARYAIHRIVQDKVLHEKLEAKDYTVSRVKILFAGLYDTVASYGLAHYNDTENLNLDTVARAGQVLHLCAAEEYRENFRLTNISSTPHGREVFLPGVHSDVGGGYVDATGEKVVLFEGNRKDAERDRDWLIASGWYQKEELTMREYKHPTIGRDTHYQNKSSIRRYRLTGQRKAIRSQYSYIPLQIMARYAEKTGIKFKVDFKEDYMIPTDLVALKTELDNYVDGGNSSAADWINRRDVVMQRIRHEYFHFSANLSGVGMDPAWSDGQRTRVIQNG